MLWMSGLIAVIFVVTISCGVGSSDPLASLFDPTAENRSIEELVVGESLEIVNGVVFTITDLTWKPSVVLTPAGSKPVKSGFIVSSASKVLPRDPTNRFLVVTYEIQNNADAGVQYTALTDLINLRDDHGQVFSGLNVELERRKRIVLYGTSGDDRPAPLRPGRSIEDIIFFEVSSTLPGLHLISDQIGFMTIVPVDDPRGVR